ncbi:glycosyltransferase family 2 protein [Xinfangfangia sp. CPCC 101601]|uniref:Glycosyltransferase family 2 protein n=1 Tax=Pseudogemmobacter lacusdianii TaxID=3069608 RepID=A0ABU0VZU2_9RHOB|nr:glycosyltransferase family 2 protein [Xinfangfangia sp. CPCC 101601]MDQ2067266.1 glycosyltransferase family 2 protein [Xinfangfangia sp. CPCC 101601]
MHKAAAEEITIVMATRNGAAHLPAQLASIAAQSHRNWRLFVSDDGSSDATLTLLQDFARNHPVQLIQGPQQGAAANFLSALCHPDLPRGPIALADQDDIWLKGKLARGLRRLHSATGPALYAAESLLADEAGKPFRRSHSGRAQPSFAASLVQNLFAGHTMMFNAATLDLLRHAGAPQGIAFHDWWIYQLSAGAGARLILDPLPTALYRQHSSNALGATGRRQALSRLNRVLTQQWRSEIEAHALALQGQSPLLTPQAQGVLEAFLAMPKSGWRRVQSFQNLGAKRSSPSGQALMLGAAFAGLL